MDRMEAKAKKPKKPKKPEELRSGAVVWEGISKLDGRTPIAVVVTWYTRNHGTGDMAQAWMLRTDMHPLDAIYTGADRAVCPESCPMRPSASNVKGRAQCYAATGLTARSLGGIFKVLDRYPRLSPEMVADRLVGRRLRIGAYADPAAVPPDLWPVLISKTRGHTGYTHKIDLAPSLGKILMVSADSAEQALAFQARGYRTYRTRHVDANGVPEPLLRGEIVCPKTPEGGHRKTCADCLLCDGTLGRSKVSIAAIDHSGSARMRLGNRLLPMVA